jgi:hypothetical protein
MEKMCAAKKENLFIWEFVDLEERKYTDLLTPGVFGVSD